VMVNCDDESKNNNNFLLSMIPQIHYRAKTMSPTLNLLILASRERSPLIMVAVHYVALQDTWHLRFSRDSQPMEQSVTFGVQGLSSLCYLVATFHLMAIPKTKSLIEREMLNTIFIRTIGIQCQSLPRI
jgi:hypothetical protein